MRVKNDFSFWGVNEWTGAALPIVMGKTAVWRRFGGG